jgi:hypothetical protein
MKILGKIGVVLALVLSLGMAGCASTAPVVQPADIVNDIACVSALAGIGVSISSGVGAAAAIGIIQSQGPAIAQSCAAMLASLQAQVAGQVNAQKVAYAKTHAAAAPGHKLVAPISVK